VGGQSRGGQLDPGRAQQSGGCKKNLLRDPDLLEALKQRLDKLCDQLGRSRRWLTGVFAGIVATIVDWLRRPPSGSRPGRPQLNVTEAQLAAALNLSQAYPFMGGKKGAANLVHDQAAWIGAGSYDAIKGTLAQQIGEELKKRRSGRPEPEPFEPPVATGLGQVWGTDLFEVTAWDVRFDICDFLDIFNQEYLALRATLHAADSKFVADCFELACQEQGGRAPTVGTTCDRGSQFYGHFEEALEDSQTTLVRIPPGCPWFNLT
jgi:transposase InsO family protein